MHIAKFRNYNDRDDPISEIPPTSNIPINIEWVAYFWVKYLINDPPNKYPTALTKKMYEKDVYDFPVACAKYGMIGPMPVMMLPYSTNE